MPRNLVTMLDKLKTVDKIHSTSRTAGNWYFESETFLNEDKYFIKEILLKILKTV